MIAHVAEQDQLMGWSAWGQVDHGVREQDVDHLLGEDINLGVTAVPLDFGVLERCESTKTGTAQGTVPRHPDLQAFYRLRKRVVGPKGKVFIKSEDSP